MESQGLAVLSTLLVGSLAGCNNHSPFYEEYEDRGLTNSEYTSRCVSGQGYPGATRIDTMYKNDGINTGWSCRWSKVAIPQTDYEALWSNEAELVRDGQFTIALTTDGRSLDRLKTDEALTPTDWPPSYFSPPRWWRLPEAGKSVEISAWRETTAESPSDTSYSDSGTIWIYDVDSETLWDFWWSERF